MMATLVGTAAGAAEVGGAEPAGAVAGVWAWASDTIPQATTDTTRLFFKLVKLLNVRIAFCDSGTPEAPYCFLVGGGCGAAGLGAGSAGAGDVEGCA